MSEAQNIYNSPSTESYEVEAGQETHLKRVGVLSCAIVLAVLYALLGLFAGGIMFLVSLAGAGAAASSGAGGDVFAKLGIGGAALVIFIPVIYESWALLAVHLWLLSIISLPKSLVA